MTAPEPSPLEFTAKQVRQKVRDLRGRSDIAADMLDAFADLLEARAAKPEPSPLLTHDDECVLMKHCQHDDNARGLLLRLVAQARAASPWQPIETAPKDTSILVSDGVDVWETHLGNLPYTSATTWQPLPSPPAQDGGKS